MHQPIFFVDCSSLFVNNSVHIIGCSLAWKPFNLALISTSTNNTNLNKIILFWNTTLCWGSKSGLQHESLTFNFHKQFWKIYSHWLFLSALLRLVVCGPLQSLMLLADQTRNFPKWPRPRKWMIKESCNLGTDYKTVSLNYK